MNKRQLRELIVIPTLLEIPKGHSEEAALAIMMIVAHESARGHYLKQNGGPALGLGNMEPLTHNETWKHGDSIWTNASALGFIDAEDYCNRAHPKPERMNYDLRYAVFMMRQRLFMKKEKLPVSIFEMSVYLKKHWNSTDGAATKMSYANDYKRWT